MISLALRLGLNLCVILAKYYIYTAFRREEEYIWQAFYAFLRNHLEIEKHQSKLQGFPRKSVACAIFKYSIVNYVCKLKITFVT